MKNIFNSTIFGFFNTLGSNLYYACTRNILGLIFLFFGGFSLVFGWVGCFRILAKETPLLLRPFYLLMALLLTPIGGGILFLIILMILEILRMFGYNTPTANSISEINLNHLWDGTYVDTLKLMYEKLYSFIAPNKFSHKIHDYVSYSCAITSIFALPPVLISLFSWFSVNENKEVQELYEN